MDVSGEHVASIFRVEKLDKHEAGNKQRQKEEIFPKISFVVQGGEYQLPHFRTQ
jgi:hypothetical protein